MLKFKNMFLLLVILLLALAGCENDEEKVKGIHQHLEETVSLEKGFENVQQPILDAEKQEQQLYEEIIKLSLEDIDQISKLAIEAVTSAKNRKKLIEQEKESIELAYNEFQLINPLIEEVETEEIKKKSKDLQSKMKDRYESYQILHEEYTKGIDSDIYLYEMLQEKDISITELEDHIDKLNKQYELIMNAKDNFNKATEAYNNSKKEFYKVAGLDVEITY
jgi:hypothetical protein